MGVSVGGGKVFDGVRLAEVVAVAIEVAVAGTAVLDGSSVNIIVAVAVGSGV